MLCFSMNRLRADAITDIALKAGCIVLENGGETYRTEDTIMRIAFSQARRRVGLRVGVYDQNLFP